MLLRQSPPYINALVPIVKNNGIYRVKVVLYVLYNMHGGLCLRDTLFPRAQGNPGAIGTYIRPCCDPTECTETSHYGWGHLVPEGCDIRSVVKAWQLAVVTLLAFRVSFPNYTSFTYPDTSV